MGKGQERCFLAFIYQPKNEIVVGKSRQALPSFLGALGLPSGEELQKSDMNEENG